MYWDTKLNAEIDVLRESVQEFAKREIMNRASEIDQQNEFPQDLWKKFGEMGLLGITVAQEYGGSAMSYLAHTVAMEEISKASAAVGLSYGANSNLCINNISIHANESQKRKYLPKLCSGEYIGALSMSEAEAGSDVMSMRCFAEKQGNHWIANGSKMWVTNGPDADVLFVYMKTNKESNAGSNCITPFMIEKGMKGFSTAQKLDKLGMRGSNTCELIFEDCIIPDENRVGEIDKGVQVLMHGLNLERVILAGGPIGIMQAAIELVLPYVHERKQFGRPIGTFELMQGKIADMYCALQASRAFVYRVAENCDRKQVSRKDTAACLLFSSESCVKVALEAIQSLGGNGYTNEYPAARLLRDAKLYSIGAGTNEVRRMLIGRELFEDTL